ncbi:bifunctional aspartate kinase/homoserine dehydrogenase I [Flocculibacter collagenilyticus]|uniref:bifunctional aspartate kinase/homoserine dehydrogenase I n=1 Tax=Flocculibacter collagenilyticus TaxID=2744479 RepID=UPI0018F2D3FB|nr:bifunctional aspartate kinase/homoserine dehydrogenase I [Flocculibacter collagenilyticus]
MQVLKFGGSSLANAERISAVAQLIKQRSDAAKIMVVLSAPQGVTNELVEMSELAFLGYDFKESVAKQEQRLTGLVESFECLSELQKNKLKAQLITTSEKLLSLLEGIKLLNFCPDHVKAQIICQGEKLSIALMEEVLKSDAIAATSLDAMQCIRSSENYLNSSANITTSKTLFAEQIAKKPAQVYLLAGFTAANERGELTTLGRNGSDYSAAVAAACVDAEVCEIWTDVDGVYSADPRLVNSAMLVDRLSYSEAMELSYFGAKVLHPKTIGPLAQYKIPCVIKNTLNPEAPGTLIDDADKSGDAVKAISSLDQLTMLTLSGPGMKGVVGMAGRVFSTMARNNISVILITQSSCEFSISFCTHSNALERASRALQQEFDLELQNKLLHPIEFKKNLSIVSLVGDGMKKQRGIAAKFFASLAQARVNVVAIAQDSTERSISAVIKAPLCEEALKVCHENFFTHALSIDVFLVGCGTVGKALLAQIQRQQTLLADRNIKLNVFGIANSKRLLLSPDGIALDNWERQLSEADSSFSLVNVSRFVEENHLVNPVLVDCTSSEHIAVQYADFLAAGFHVVTPNKKANTGSVTYYNQIRETAQQNRRRFLYETNVGAGLPVIDTLQGLFNAGDEMLRFEGILSGSLSYIFGKLDEGMSLAEATKVARENGYTEPDPRDDLSGMDVARKLLIMAREAGLQLELHDIDVESVLPEGFDADGSIEQFMDKLPQLNNYYRDKVALAEQSHKVLRYVGVIEDGQCRVAIEAVDANNPLFSVKNGENALAIHSHYYQPIPFVLRGYGAGAEVTAAGVFGDIMRTLSWQQEM